MNKQDQTTKIRIVSAINRLPEGDVKRLQGTEKYRLRVGDFRVIFDKQGEILYIEKSIIEGRSINNFEKVINMSAIKERILGAVTIMNDSDAEKLWSFIKKQFSISWEKIEDITPDEWDLQMLHEIEIDPDCQNYVSSEEALKVLGL